MEIYKKIPMFKKPIVVARKLEKNGKVIVKIPDAKRHPLFKSFSLQKYISECGFNLVQQIMF